MRAPLAIAFAVLACSKRNESTPIVAEPAGTAPSASSSSKPVEVKTPKPDPKLLTPSDASRAACAKLAAEHAKALAAALAKDPDLVVGAIPAALGTCLPYASGAWALVLEGAVDAPSEHYGGPSAIGGVSARWSLVHVDLAGARTSIAPRYLDIDDPLDTAPDGADNLVAGDVHHYTMEARLFDANGDGVAELFLHYTLSLYEGQTGDRGAAWTVAGGHVVRPPGAENADVERLDDFDHDGLMDLVTYAGEKQIVGLEEGTLEATGIPRLLHADLARQTYDAKDAVALAFARVGCPKPPARYVTSVLDASTFANVSCARAWGVPPADVKKALVAELAPDPLPAPLDAWITRTPPLRLP